MGKWTIIIVVVILIVIAAVIIATVYIDEKNKSKKQENVLYPFSAQLSPPSPPWTVNTSNNNTGVQSNPEDGLYIVGMAGGQANSVPQIQCPSGYKINIVGAFVDVIDPYGECTNKSDNILELTCGIPTDTSAAASCNSSNDCGAGMTCTQNKCLPRVCKSNSECGGSSSFGTVNSCDSTFMQHCSSSSDCGSGMQCVNNICLVDPGQQACMACVDPTTGAPPEQGAQGYCSTMPLCQNVTSGLNDTCSPSNGDKYRCRPRDATVYLSQHCDGKNVCLGDESDKWIPGSSSVFGPTPCEITAFSNNFDYASLPIVNGWSGGSPIGGSDSAPPNFSQGYYVHGIYTCIPDSQNAVTK